MPLSVTSFSTPKRRFLPTSFEVSDWNSLKPYVDRLLEAPVDTLDRLKKWLRWRSELDSAIAEDVGWRYIKMTCFTDQPQYGDRYRFFMERIQPQLSLYANRLNKKMTSSPVIATLEKRPDYTVAVRSVRQGIALFREKNIPLFTQIDALTQEYTRICGAMTVRHEGKEITLQQAAALLMSPNRDLREKVYKKIARRRLDDKEPLDKLFSDLVAKRHKVALNAGFDNFCDYMFKVYCRFDYTPRDCSSFHAAVGDKVVPLLDAIASQRKKDLGVAALRPWDKAADPLGRPPLDVFDGEDELVNKTIACFTRIDPFFGECLTEMRRQKRLDLTSRRGKAPGGYNYPLPDTGIPFIFMNATSTLRDMATLIHEGGHALHNFLTADKALLDFKSPPMEVAELASMAMELISMEHWDVFFSDREELRRARREHLEGIIETLPWVAVIDKYQQWIYAHPRHTSPERKRAWSAIFDELSDTITDWDGLQEAKDYLWQKQLHLYEVPLYYIEYGIAQLGAIALWRNYKSDSARGLKGYTDALRLGNTRSIPEIYEAARIRFDFSGAYIGELMGFVKREMENL